MAGAGYKLFNTGDVLTAAQVNEYLMQQTVMVFADAAARTTALSGVVAEGMISYLKDTNAVEVYNGSAWVASDDPNAIQNTIVDAKGDLITATAADTPARLASSGVNGDVLTVDTSTATGLKWAAAAASSPLTTKGDLYTYSTTNARLGVGANGETLVADSGTTTGLTWQADWNVGKNKFINGDFRIWQRGTSFSNPTGGTYTSDRWRVGYDGTASTTRTFSRETFTPGTAPVAGYEGTYYARITTTTKGSNTRSGLAQLIEGVRTFAGQTVTVSFWGKCDTNRSGHIEILQNFGTGGSPSSQVSVTNSSISLTSSWQRISVTVSVPSISGKTLGTDGNDYLVVSFYHNTADGATFDIWGTQIEAGSVATPFTTATGTLQGELAACQRYYVRYERDTSERIFANGSVYNSTTFYAVVHFPTQMRDYPVLTASGTNILNVYANNASFASTNVTLGTANKLACSVTVTISGATGGNGGFCSFAVNNSSIAFSAEL